MLIEQALKEAIGSGTSASERIYPSLLPQDPVLPAITYARVGGANVASFDGQNATLNGRMQVDCWGETYAAAKALSKEVRDALEASTLSVVCENEIDFFERAPETHRVSLDFSCWHIES